MCAAQCYTVAGADAKTPEFVLGGPAWVPHQTEERQPAITHVPKSINYYGFDRCILEELSTEQLSGDLPDGVISMVQNMAADPISFRMALVHGGNLKREHEKIRHLSALSHHS